MRELDRRTVLTAGGSVAAVALAGCTDDGGSGGDGDGGGGAGAGDGDEPGNESGGGGGATTQLRLGGRTSGWVGRAPQSIEGQTNPTLQLEPGKQYELTWENLDGQEHELIIESADGTELAATESTSEQGATRSVTFTAEERTAAYYCEYHPQSMRGEVQTGGGGGAGTATNGTGSNATDYQGGSGTQTTRESGSGH